MNKLTVSVIALAESESKSGNYVLILEETISKKRIPIIIGTQEAQSIAIFMERLFPQRPLTHDLFKNTFSALKINLKEVLIHKIENDIFYCNLLLQNTAGELVEIDARPSDAIALAIRFSCPIFISEQILNNSGYELDEKGREKKSSYAEYSTDELEELLSKVLLKEDYESAARLRNTIEKRKKQND